MYMTLDREEEDTERSEPPKLYIPAEAVKYLQEKRGIVMTVAALRQRRKRGTAKQDKSRIYERTSLWTQEELDAIEPSLRTKRTE